MAQRSEISVQLTRPKTFLRNSNRTAILIVLKGRPVTFRTRSRFSSPTRRGEASPTSPLALRPGTGTGTESGDHGRKDMNHDDGRLRE
ncbi:hypothetical protein KC19_11G168600 [Ceratodon purpureus]|uniref:Uncharacterized protein n=1 Tax=Ceratodon purpureus TaxID=3225 RepID=A0A8T0GIH5_CERPU|nr:hypothetical protein KC19_11G168600 [Ceratodon purpureus]